MQVDQAQAQAQARVRVRVRVRDYLWGETAKYSSVGYI